MELGITTFAETYRDPKTGETISHGERLRQVLEEIVLAEHVGLAVYGVGEHHRPDFASSAPAVVLAAAAGRTERIRLTPAVIILSSADPVRTFQDFATLDLVSSGRAELLVGRGSFIESFPLFGYSLSDYDELFSEKLDLLLAIRDQERITWSGKHRPALHDQSIYPRPEQDPLPIWVGVGGSPTSIVRAATRGLPVALAIIGGNPDRFADFADLHRSTLVDSGHDPAAAPLAVHAHGYIADSNEQAADEYYNSYAVAMTQLGRERGWGPMTRPQYDMMRGPGGSLVLGDVETVAAKILRIREILGIQRFMLHISVGTLPHEQVLHAIELLGKEVAPIVQSADA
jgi:probable LLM family oxidoreductase